jgi:S1-C subfamily serine protease
MRPVLPSRVLGVPESDIALLHVDATGMQPIAIADTEDVQPGHPVLAIDNPSGSSSGSPGGS